MVDKTAELTHISSSTSGKANQAFNFHMHYAVPFRNVKHTYFAVHYHEWMSNSANDCEKKAQPSRDLEGWMKAIELVKDYSPNTEVVVLIPKNESFADRLGHRLPWIFSSFGIGALIVFYHLAIYQN